jgi:FlaA1/EpsC-like NDP-sugar epimerase
MKKQIFQQRLLYIFFKLKKFPYLSRKIVLVMDILFVIMSFLFSNYICYFFLDYGLVFDYYIDLPIYIVVVSTLFILFNTSSEFLRFSSYRSILRILFALFCTNLFLLLLFWIKPNIFYYTAYTKVGFIINFLLSCCAIGFCRMLIYIV